MNKDSLKKYLLQKDELWQYIFLTMLLQQHGLLLTDLKEVTYDVTICFKFGENTDDLDNLWKLAEWVDGNYETIQNSIDKLRYCTPIPWQYDFVKTISRICQINIVQTLSSDALITAYCWSLGLQDEAVIALMEAIDLRYKSIFKSLNEKESKLKRNLLLTLECLYGDKLPADIYSYTFRDIMEEYINVSDYNGFLQALKNSTTAETKLTTDERTCLAFAYNSPYFDNRVNIERGFLPQSSLFANVHEYMHAACNMWQANKQRSAEDEDFEPLTETFTYVDPAEMCIINVHADKQFYANVYIKRLNVDCLWDKCQDFLVYHQKFLYTVEFVNDFSEIPAIAKFVKLIANSHNDLAKVVQQLNNLPPKPSKLRQQYLQTRNELYDIIQNSYLVPPFSFE